MIEQDPTKRLKLAGVRRHAVATGWKVVPVASRFSRPRDIPALLEKYRPIGCIRAEDDLPKRLPLHLFNGLPLVLANENSKRYDTWCGRICVDNAAVANAAFRELSAASPETFAIVGNPWPRTWSTVREKAFRALARKSGRPCITFPTHSDDTWESFALRLRGWIPKLQRRTAVYAVNDKIAVAAAKAAREAGFRIPQDITLVGTDNELPCCETPGLPSISSIQLDFERMGYLAAKSLSEMMDDRPRESSGHVTTVGPLMVVRRESTRGFGRREHFVLEAVEIIRREACDGLTAQALISRFRASRRLFDLRFREAMGHSALDEILHVRLERVLDLLANPRTAIGAIAGLCGFGTERELNKLFLSRFGCSMREWRKRNAAL